MKHDDVFVVIPAYNEGKRIGAVLDSVKNQVRNIVVVDDGSSDNTFEKAKERSVVVIRGKRNKGKGAALRKGCDFAVKQGAEKIVVLDSDGQHDPTDIPRFLHALSGKDIVFGSRSLNGDMPTVLRFGNEFINKTVSVLFGVTLKDTQSGFRAFRVGVYDKIRWKASGYAMESEMIARVGQANLRYKEIFIKTIYHDAWKGTGVLDGIKIVLHMLWWKIKGL